MTAYADHCECTVCGTVCTGRFAGCGAVWARGPREVSVNAPRLIREDAPKIESERWRLPLEAVASSLGLPSIPEAEPEPVPTTEPALSLVLDTPAFDTASDTAEPDPEHADASEPPAATLTSLETPDVTARYAVAQLSELNARVAGLTEDTLGRTEEALTKVAMQLERLASQREIDLTEQAAGIFGAVQAGADALAEFSQKVGEVTEDLRLILTDALKAIGGTDGLAAWVAASAAEVTETREEFLASLGRIERDITLLRRRANAEAKEAKSPKPAKLDDDQLTLIVDAVTDAVLAALEHNGGRRRR
ncbi:MAG TPA: hypothetical protein VHC63_01100 [Acidimicrobiales bacterium]|nr:hypothetical protein [Acidimicrobiales bacterium]